MFTASLARSSVLMASIGLALGLAAQTAEAAPLLDITKPPVASGANPNTGPANDPTSSSGQWFQTVLGFNGDEPIRGPLEHRKQEFYDNQTGNGGGFASTDAINGFILPGSITQDGNGDVTGFTVRATITNDLPPVGPWLDGANSHGETLHEEISRVQDLHNVALTAEFADDGVRGNFSTAGAPYFGPESNIFAKNYDELAWYSYTNTGAFQVPAWDFGNIPLGASVTRDLAFGLYNPVAPATINFLLGQDIFMNRTTDLKIGDYFEKGTGLGPSYEGLAVDDGSAYPTSVNRSGNVSVFAEVPEPASLALLAAGFAGLAAAGRRKKA